MAERNDSPPSDPRANQNVKEGSFAMKSKIRVILAVMASLMMLCNVLCIGSVSVTAAPNDIVMSYDFNDGNAVFERAVAENGYIVFDATTADWQNSYVYANGITANTDYVVSFKAKANKDCQMSFKINNDWTGDLAVETVNVTTEWQDYEFIINSGELTSTAIVMFSSSATAAAAAVYCLDDIVIKEYLDPALYGKLVNGDFENGSEGWALGNGASIVDGALQLDNPSQWSEAAMQTMYVKANTAYRMTWLSKRVSGTGAFNLYLMDGDNNNITVSGHSWMNETSGEWVLNTVNFTSLGEVLKIKFSTEGNDSGVILIDDVKVFEPPIIENADFETGDNTGWEIHQSTSITADAAHDGSYGAHLVGGGTYGGMLNQALSVKAGKNYEITFWLKVNANGVNVQLMDGDANGNKLAAGWFDTNSAGEWTQKVFIVSPTTDVIFVNFCGAGNSIAEDAYVDSFTAVELKDPSFDGYITNGDFETGRTGSWDPVWWAGNIAIVEGGHNGDYAMQVNHGMYQLVRQLVTVEPNTDYVVQCYAKNVSSMTLLAKSYPADANIAQASINGGDDWTQNSLVFNSGDCTQVYIGVMGNADGATAIVDDFFMFEKVEESNDGYIVNGTFETGALTPWNNLWGSCPKAEIVRGGMDSNFALEVVSGQWKHVRQTNIAVEANTNYKITAWAKNAQGMSLLVKDGGDSVDIVNAGIEAGDEWTEFVIEFNTGDYTSIIFSLMGNNAEAAFGTFDNIVMEKVESAVIYGDANGDGSVNARDAALLQQYVAGWDVTLDAVSGDANGDGSVNARDAALLQQYVAGWDVTLGA